ncbi:MAG: hypothetical protein WCG04_05325 [Alphaproteobacteria bacterium]
MRTRDDFLELHEAVEFLIADKHPDFSLFKESIEIGEMLRRFSYEKTMQVLQRSRKYSDRLFFLIKQKLPSFLLLSDQTYIKISHDYCETADDFYAIVMLHCANEYKHLTLDKAIDAKICVAKAGLQSNSVDLGEVYSEGAMVKILGVSLEEQELNPFLRYFCYLSANKKNADFQMVTHKTQYEVVDIIDPQRKYQDFGLKIDPQRELNEPFHVIRLFIKGYKPTKGRPATNVIDIHPQEVAAS